MVYIMLKRGSCLEYYKGSMKNTIPGTHFFGRKLIKIFLLAVLIIRVFIVPESAYALTYDLIAPTGQLEAGQEVKFTIDIDTEGKPYASTQVGMTYDTEYLEYISTSVGNTFTTVSAAPEEEGRLIITGSSPSGYNGSGTFAYVTYKIIAKSSGSTQLCVLFNPDTSPTPASNQPTSTPAPGQPTTVPVSPPTALPTSGDVNGVSRGVVLGMMFLILAGSGFFVFKNL